MKEEYPPESEAIYLKKNRQFTKVRITYNKEFLPTKIEWYYKGKEGLKWYTWRTYSYPFKNKSDFDKRLDEEIETIKAIQEENEGDYTHRSKFLKRVPSFTLSGKVSCKMLEKVV